jgi:hypothetical protein
MVGSSIWNRVGPQHKLIRHNGSINSLTSTSPLGTNAINPGVEFYSMNSLSLQAASPTLIQRVVKRLPGNTALRHYQRAWLPRDLVAGLVLCALLVPQGIAYAELAGLPAIIRLYTNVVCLAAYALFDPSPHLVLGPGSLLGPMIAAMEEFHLEWQAKINQAGIN